MSNSSVQLVSMSTIEVAALGQRRSSIQGPQMVRRILIEELHEVRLTEVEDFGSDAHAVVAIRFAGARMRISSPPLSESLFGIVSGHCITVRPSAFTLS